MLNCLVRCKSKHRLTHTYRLGPDPRPQGLEHLPIEIIKSDQKVIINLRESHDERALGEVKVGPRVSCHAIANSRIVFGKPPVGSRIYINAGRWLVFLHCAWPSAVSAAAGACLVAAGFSQQGYPMM